MKFDNYRISTQIKSNLESKDFRRPTDIQYKAIPPILRHEDVLAIAQTGTGKTAAFAIPVLHLLQARIGFGIRCLVMAPTHELALQIAEVFETIGQNTGIKTLCVIGGVDQAPQIESLSERIDVLVATPGRMFDLVSQGFIKLDHVEILILDEADYMLDLGFIHDIRQLTQIIPRKHQTLFFSATINEEIKNLAYSLVQNPIRIQISPKDPVSKNVTHSVAFIEMDDKRFFLERLIGEHPDSKILVFVRTKVRAERVFEALKRVGIASQTIHGDKDQTERAAVMQQFREGINKILIATDVSARGIDVANIEYVINYDLPEDVENYVHRVGRTGRGVSKGIAISFCSADEKELLEAIEIFMGKEITVLEINRAEYADTLFLAEDTTNNWKALIKEDLEFERKKKKKNKKKL